jgi:ubiquitin-protein ligase
VKLTPPGSRDVRLQQERLALEGYRNPAVSIQAIDPPHLFRIVYRCAGIVDATGRVAREHMVELRLPPQFPEVPPEFRVKTPIFHPNVWPNGLVCLAIEGGWRRTIDVSQLVVGVGRLIEYQVCEPDNHALNGWFPTQWKRWLAERTLPLGATDFVAQAAPVVKVRRR